MTRNEALESIKDKFRNIHPTIIFRIYELVQKIYDDFDKGKTQDKTETKQDKKIRTKTITKT